MKSWLFAMTILGCVPALAGLSMVVDDIDTKTVVVKTDRNGVLRFHDNSGNLFFIRCESYAFNNQMTFSSMGKVFSTTGASCGKVLEGIQGDLEKGKKLESLEVQIDSDSHRSEQMKVQPHYL